MDTFERESTTSTAYTFAGHQTFALRSGWLKKGYDALLSEGPGAFSKDDAIVTLGVGKNMVTSIRHWLVMTGVAGEDRSDGRAAGLYATPFGERIFSKNGLDPYLEFDATLWLLHARLASAKGTAFTWLYTFHRWRRPEIYRDKLAEAIQLAAQNFPRPPSTVTVARDVDCFIHTYVRGRSASEETLDSPLATLGLIVPDQDQGYRFAVGPKPRLSPAVFAWALARFMDLHRPLAKTVSAAEIIYEEGAPGVLFKLDEESVLEYLDGLEDTTGGALRFEDTPQSQQVVRIAEKFDDKALLGACYARR